MQIERFEVAIPDADLADMRRRIDDTRWADDFGNADWRYGVERNWLADMVRFWRDEYDWRAEERRMNRHPHYRTEIDGVPIHFLHIPGKRLPGGPAPTPLLLVHGWPWTFMDYFDLIAPLTDPAAHGGNPHEAFDVVIPSLPGYAFSAPLTKTGLTIPRLAELFARLMREGLGYARHGVAGGDWGAAITTHMAHAFPEQVIGVLATIPYFAGLDLAAIPDADHAPDEQWMLERKRQSAGTTMSHFVVQSTDPQTLAYALTDSPVGTAAWLWERRRAWSDWESDDLPPSARTALCTLASLLWLTRTIGSSMRTYWEHAHAGGLPIAPLHDRQPAIEVPAGFAIFPREVMLIPRAVAARGTNLQRWTLMERGGHFGPSEEPEAMARELRAFFGALCKSG